MRRVAEELGTAPSALYWHVRNKDELLQLVLDRVVGEIELPPRDPETLAGAAEGAGARDAPRLDQPPRHRAGHDRRDSRRPERSRRRRVGARPAARGRSARPHRRAGRRPLGPLRRRLRVRREPRARLTDGRGPAARGSARRCSGSTGPPCLRTVSLTLLLWAICSSRAGPDERFEFGLDVLIRGLESLRAEAAS